MQTRLSSLTEQLLSTAIGFIVSLLVWELVVKPLWHIQTSISDNFQITVLFTVVSICRGYWVRRLFNRLNNKNN